MRDARPGGGALKPQLISEHGAGQQANKAAHPRNVAQQQRRVQHVVDNYAKNPREGARQLKALGMSGDFIRAIHRSSVSNPKTRPAPGTHPGRDLLGALDTAASFVIGEKPSRIPHNLSHPFAGNERRALDNPQIGIVPWGPFGRGLSRAVRPKSPVAYTVKGEPHVDMPQLHGGPRGVKAGAFVGKDWEISPAPSNPSRPRIWGNGILEHQDKGGWLLHHRGEPASTGEHFQDIKQAIKTARQRSVQRADQPLASPPPPNERAPVTSRHTTPAPYGSFFSETTRSPREAATSALKKAPASYREQKALRHEELGKRVQAAEQALHQGHGEEAFHAAMSELKGPLPKTQFHGLRNLTEHEMDALREHVKNHPDLQFFDKATAWNAVRNAHLHGEVPTPSEYKILQKAFGPEFTAQNFSPSALSKYRHMAIETANIPRAIMSSFDVSAPMRQGLVGFGRHPILSSRELKPMVKALGSEKFYRNWRQQLEAHPKYELADKSGLALTDIEHALSNREEPFQSNYAERIPVAGRVVRGSGRAYNRFLVGQRFSIFDHLTNYAEDHGIPLSEKAHRQLADYINSATGRGNLGRFERSAVGLNSIFFSPRLIASRLDFLRPDKYMGLDPFVRRQKLRAAFQTAAAVSTFLAVANRVAGVKVGLDPRSSDFGKIRIGNTRIDIGGGFNQYIRLISQLASGETVNANTGAVQHGQGWNSLGRFVRGKLAPTTSLLTDIATRSNYAGQPINPKSEIASRVTPLVLQDAYAVQQQTHNPAAALGAYALGATGVGIQSYGQTKTQKAKTTDDLRNAFAQSVQQYFHRPLTPQIDKALKLRQQRTDYLSQYGGKRPKRGASEEDKQKYALARYNAQVDLMRKSKMITSAQAATAKRWASKQDRHVLSSRTSELGRKYFGGTVLSSAAKKIRDRGGKLYLGDY